MDVMEFTGRIVVAENYCVPAGGLVDSVSISSEPIEKLIDNLRGRGVDIDSSNSLMDIRFDVRGMRGMREKKAGVVMLGTTFPRHVDVVAYHLRDAKGLLELEISDYEDDRSLGRPGDVGGTIEGEAGVVCDFSLRTKNGDVSVVREIRAAMEEIYRVDSSESLLDGAVVENSPDIREKVRMGLPSKLT
jgi:hypothetical protein